MYLPTIVSSRVLWHLGYTEEASAAALTQSYDVLQRAASQQDPSYQVRGILTDGFDSTTKSMRTLFAGARLGNCLRHALNKLPGKPTAIASPVRKALRARYNSAWNCERNTLRTGEAMAMSFFGSLLTAWRRQLPKRAPGNRVRILLVVLSKPSVSTPRTR